LTETQSSLLGGENTPLHEGIQSTGFDGVTPRKHVMATPNPMATNGISATPLRAPGATPLRTPRDNFSINRDGEKALQSVGSTPRELKVREHALRNQLKSQFASLPKPKETDWELELPEDQQENFDDVALSEEDATERDRRNAASKYAAERTEFKRRTQVMQRGLPRPAVVDIDAMIRTASAMTDPSEKAVAQEMALLVAADSLKYPVPGSKVQGVSKPLELFENGELEKARREILLEAENSQVKVSEYVEACDELHDQYHLPGLSGYASWDECDEQVMTEAFDNIQKANVEKAKKGNEIEKKLALHLGGYQQRAKTLRQKIVEAREALEKASISLDTFRTLQVSEAAAIPRRLEALREEVNFISKREREAQETYRARKEELEGLNSIA